ncbi:PH domain-like [Phytophthora cactorum]|nr:PH domain-like [Phytophthora cactorum]
MESLHCDDFKLQICPLVWRHVQIRLSIEQHWTKRHDVLVLSVTRSRRRPLSSDRVLIEQISLDSSTRLVSPTSRDLRRLRFTLQYGGIRHHFQAPDESAYEKWCLVIADAISGAQEMEQKLQTTNNSNDKRSPVDHIHADVYDRDATNYKLIQLHRLIPSSMSPMHGDSVVTVPEDINHGSHADICIEKLQCAELDTVTITSSDDEYESPKHYPERWREQCQPSAFGLPVKPWSRVRPLTARETMRRRLVSDARKHCMLSYDSTRMSGNNRKMSLKVHSISSGWREIGRISA